MKFKELSLEQQIEVIKFHKESIEDMMDEDEIVNQLQMTRLIRESLAMTDFIIKDDGTIING